MGLFDTVFVHCRVCGSKIGFQSKAGDCTLDEYTLLDVPDAIAGDLIGKTATCKECGNKITLEGKVIINPVYEHE